MSTDLIFIIILFLIIAVHQLAYVQIQKVNAASLDAAAAKEYARFAKRTLQHLQAFLVSVVLLFYLADWLGLPLAYTLIAYQVLWLLSRQMQSGGPARSSRDFALYLLKETLIAGGLALVIGYVLTLFTP